MSDFKKPPRKKRAPLPPQTAALLDDWADWLTINLGRARSTAATYKAHAAEFLAYLADAGRTLDTTSAEDVRSWQRHIFQQRRNLSGQTRATKLAAVRMFYRWLMETALVTTDPTKDVPSPLIQHKLPRKLSDDQLRDLLTAPDTTAPEGFRDLALLITLYTTGARVSELCALDVESVSFVAQEARVLVMGKGRKERVVTVRAPASRVLRAWAKARVSGPLFVSIGGSTPGHRLTPYGVNYILKKYGAIVGIKSADIFAHILRATFATNLYDDGCGIKEISLQMGHVDIKTTDRYIAVSDKVLRGTAISGRRLRRLGIS